MRAILVVLAARTVLRNDPEQERECTIPVSLCETACGQSDKPVQAESRDSLRQGASQAAGAAPTLRYGPAGDSAPRLRLKAAGMTERFPSGPASTARKSPPAVSFWAHRYLWLLNAIK